jgi:MFS family permease
MSTASGSTANYSPRFFYGWVIVWLAFVTMGFHITARFSFAIFQVPLIDEFGWSRGALGGAYALMLGLYALFSPIMGSLFDKKGPRAVMPWGSVLIGCGVALGYFIDALWHVYLLTGVFIGIGMTMNGFAANGAIMPRWFQQKRGLATGIMLAGGGVGTLILSPLIERLIAYVGWRETYLIFGLTILLVISSANFLLLRNRPEDVSQSLDGLPATPKDESAEVKNASSGSPDMSQVFREVKNNPRFWALTFIVFCIGLNNNTVISQLQLYLVDAKFNTASAALVLGGLGLIRMLGSTVLGSLSDRIGRPRAQALSTGLAALGVIFLMAIPALGASLFTGVVFAFIYGMGIGGTATCHSAMSADTFKGPNFGMIMGFLEISFGVGGMLGPPMAGAIFDRTGSYLLPFSIILAALLCVVVICLFFYPAEEKG